jgi:glycerol-3-phosphate acyltransferase PlsY
MLIAKLVAAAVVGYLLGSIPFGVLVSKACSRVDVRDYGSGKTGATNVLRTVGSKKMALMVIGLDMFKGALAVILAGLIVGRSYMVVGNFAFGAFLAQVLAALAAMAGHIWPVFLKFRGGRGVSTFFGGLIALCPVAALFGGEIGLISAGLTRFASLGSITGVVGTYAILVPLTIMNGFPLEYLIYTLIGALLIIVMHRDNIVRLLTGRERKLGEKAEGANPPLPTETKV